MARANERREEFLRRFQTDVVDEIQRLGEIFADVSTPEEKGRIADAILVLSMPQQVRRLTVTIREVEDEIISTIEENGDPQNVIWEPIYAALKRLREKPHV